jgi:hypothetical protein
MPERLKPIAEGLGPLFQELERRVQARVELADRVREALPSPEKDHVLSASYAEDILVVTADSAAWAARIRYAQEQLLAALSARSEMRFTKVKVRVGRNEKKGAADSG